MKHLYWRPQRVNRIAIALVAVLSVGGLLGVEELRVEDRGARYAEKVAASRKAANAMQVVKAERVEKGHPIDPTVDPNLSGMVGVLSSPITSTSGNLYAKQYSTQPTFAAMIVSMLHEAGVEEGELVAVGVSGSFPALNVSTYAAIEALGAEPVIVVSASASEWGANIVGLGWPDMEALLHDRDIFPYRSVAGSLGGLEDRGVGMSRAGVSMLRAMLERNGIPILEPDETYDTVDARMRVYEEQANGRPYAAYVNVGGGTASLGARAGRDIFSPGLNLPAQFLSPDVNSVMGRFIQMNVPVIHLSQVRTLGDRYGIPPVEPGVPPTIGEGPVFIEVRYNSWLAFAVLLTILASLYGAIRSDLGARLFQPKRSSDASRPQPMV